MKTKQDVLDWAENEPTLGPSKKSHIRVAVTALILDQDGRVLLQGRGPDASDAINCLEGFGGSLDPDEQSLTDALTRELAEEVGIGCRFSIDAFLCCSHLTFKNKMGELKDWAIVTYLVHLLTGTPRVAEPGHCDGIGWFEIAELVGWGAEESRTVALVNEHGKTIDKHVGVSIWVPTVISEYVRRYGEKVPGAELSK